MISGGIGNGVALVGEIANSLRILARNPDPCFSTEAEFSTSDGCCNSVQNIAVAACPIQPTVLGEVIRAHIDPNDFPSTALPILDLLRLEIEPFIVGCGWVVVDQLPDGLVIRLRDYGKIPNLFGGPCHV